jgi:hypothetical protein
MLSDILIDFALEVVCLANQSVRKKEQLQLSVLINLNKQTHNNIISQIARTHCHVPLQSRMSDRLLSVS